MDDDGIAGWIVCILLIIAADWMLATTGNVPGMVLVTLGGGAHHGTELVTRAARMHLNSIREQLSITHRTNAATWRDWQPWIIVDRRTQWTF